MSQKREFEGKTHQRSFADFCGRISLVLDADKEKNELISVCLTARSLLPVLSLIFVMHTAYAQKTVSPKMHKPRDHANMRLGTQVVVKGYRLRVPLGFESLSPTSEYLVDSFAWIGPKREGGTRPALSMKLITLGSAEAKTLTLTEAANSSLAETKKQYAHWTQAKTEKCVLDGLTFLYLNWTGTEPNKKRAIRGFLFVALDGDTLLQFASDDVLPQATDTLPLLEKAVRSLKRPKR